MKAMKYIAVRIFDGILYGIGIMACYAVFLFFVQGLMFRMMVQDLPETVVSEDMDPSLGVKRFDETSGLQIAEHQERTNPDGAKVILGKLKNDGSDSWQTVNIEAELYDADGKFQGEYNTYITGEIAPGETENFQLCLGSFGDGPPPQYATYSIRIADAFP